MVYEKIRAAQFRIKYKDFFHMKHLYTMMYEWLVEEGWSNRDYFFGETLYLQIEHQRAGNELWIWWRCEKMPEGVSGYSYWKFKLRIDFHVILLKDTEIIKDGKKHATNWGEVEVKIWADVITDPTKEWEKHWFLKHFNDLFRGRYLKEQTEKYKIEVYREAYRFQEAIKAFLNLKTFLPEPEGQAGMIMPKGGVGEA